MAYDVLILTPVSHKPQTLEKYKTKLQEYPFKYLEITLLFLQIYSDFMW